MSIQRPLEKVEQDAHEMATTCRICKSPFTNQTRNVITTIMSAETTFLRHARTAIES